MMAFLAAAKSTSQSERLFWGIWDREEQRALGALFARCMELLGEIHIRMDNG